MNDAGSVLRAARKAAGLTQAELARRAGVTQSVISAYEAGRREPSVATLSRLVDAAGATLQLHVEPHQVDVRRLPTTPRGELVRRNQQRMRRAAARHGVSNLRLFGSTARGDDRPDSDIDLLVHLDRQLGLIGIRHEMEDILGVPVDVVPDDGLKPDVRAAIERDAVAL